MGLILPQTVKVKITLRNRRYFKEKGYEFEKLGDIIVVNVLDLHPGSTVKVKYKCDFCGKETEVLYGDVTKAKKNNTFLTCKDRSCSNKKREITSLKKYGVTSTNQLKTVKDKKINTCQEKYGVDNPFQSQKIKEKIKVTCREHHGVDYPMQSSEIQDKSVKTLKEKYGDNITNISQVKEIQDKRKQTWKEKYGKDVTSPFQVESVQEKIKATCKEHLGVDCPLKSDSIKDKIKATNVEKYGSENPFGSKKIQKKIKETMMTNHGVEHALQNKEIQNRMKATCKERYGNENYLASDDFKNKTRDIWSFNGHDGPCSRQQKYLANLVNGKINAVVAGYWADIVLENEKIDVEYDGGGHNLCVMRKQCTQEEFDVKEKIREESICKKGYKIIRIISKQDNLPSDEIILNLIEGFKNSDFQVVRIDIDEGTIDRDYNEKWYCNFGELRRIAKKDLEEIESEKTINLK